MLTAGDKIASFRICDRELEALRVLASQYYGHTRSRGKKKDKFRASYGLAARIISDIKTWLAGASKGDVKEYFVSPAPLNAVRLGDPAVHCIANVARQLYESGYVFLIQSKSPDDPNTHYSMRRTGKGIISPLALSGTVGSTPSAKFNGVAPGLGPRGELVVPGRKAQESGVFAGVEPTLAESGLGDIGTSNVKTESSS